MEGNTDIPFNPTKKRRIAKTARVQFNDKVIFHENKSTASNQQSLPTSTWLAPNDFTKIKNSVFTTLEFIKLQGDSFGVDTPLSNRYCSRGLEDYDKEQKCLKFSTVQRRREAIQAVLQEQELQRHHLACQLQQGMIFRSRERGDCYTGQMGVLASISSQRHQLNLQRQQYMQRLDHSRIRDIYINHIYHNVEDAIDMGRTDSEDALAIYRSKPYPLAISSSNPDKASDCCSFQR